MIAPLVKGWGALMRVTALVLAAALLAATPAFAQTEPVAPPPSDPASTSTAEPAPPAGAATAPDPDEEVICRTVQRTESRLRSRRERICGTRSQWEMMQDENAREMNRVGQTVPVGPN
jgi:hypothetical protein